MLPGIERIIGDQVGIFLSDGWIFLWICHWSYLWKTRKDIAEGIFARDLIMVWEAQSLRKLGTTWNKTLGNLVGVAKKEPLPKNEQQTPLAPYPKKDPEKVYHKKTSIFSKCKLAVPSFQGSNHSMIQALEKLVTVEQLRH